MSEKINIDRLIRDIEEGIIVIDNVGTMTHINSKALKILQISDSYINKKYVSLIVNDQNNNDEFHQMLVDAIINKKIVHKRTVRYLTDSEQKTIYIASSIIKDEDGNQVGVILSFDDVSKEERLKYKINTSSLMFIILVALLSIWMFACAIYLNDEYPINSTLFGRFIMYLPLVFTPVAINVCGFTVDDLGLKTKGIVKYIIIDTIFTIIFVAIMCLIKLIILKLFPSFTFYTANNQFFDFGKYTLFLTVEYAVCVIAQEYLSRGLVYECVRRIVTTEDNSKYVDAISIIVSSLYFAALHIYLGVTYMVGAFILLSIFGVIYKKQRSIWPLCIPHFVLGMMIGVLGFTVL